MRSFIMPGLPMYLVQELRVGTVYLAVSLSMHVCVYEYMYVCMNASM